MKKKSTIPTLKKRAKYASDSTQEGQGPHQQFQLMGSPFLFISTLEKIIISLKQKLLRFAQNQCKAQ